MASLVMAHLLIQPCPNLTASLSVGVISGLFSAFFSNPARFYPFPQAPSLLAPANVTHQHLLHCHVLYPSQEIEDLLEHPLLPSQSNSVPTVKTVVKYCCSIR